MKLSVKDMIEYGYKWAGMTPLTEEEVLSGAAKGETVYVLYPDNTEAEVETMSPYIGKGLMFGIEKEEMQMSQDLLDIIATYMDDEKREQVHYELAPCSPDEFLDRYLELDPGFAEILESEFSIVR